VIVGRLVLDHLRAGGRCRYSPLGALRLWGKQGCSEGQQLVLDDLGLRERERERECGAGEGINCQCNSVQDRAGELMS
jgi:hypothetical protein